MYASPDRVHNTRDTDVNVFILKDWLKFVLAVPKYNINKLLKISLSVSYQWQNACVIISYFHT